LSELTGHQLQIRFYQDADESSIWRIAQASLGPQFNWSQSGLVSICQSHKVLIAELKTNLTMEVVAFLGFSVGLDAVEVLVLGTHPNYLGRGFMRQLLQRIFVDYKSLPVWLEVHEQNQTAIDLYLSMGFQQTGIRRRYYKDGASALLFTKEVRQS
jgi:ribosomal protein S18 acetylase RimI-like enzyme